MKIQFEELEPFKEQTRQAVRDAFAKVDPLRSNIVRIHVHDCAPCARLFEYWFVAEGFDVLSLTNEVRCDTCAPGGRGGASFLLQLTGGPFG